VATSANRPPRRVPTWLLVVGAVLVVVLVALVAVVATIALRPAPEAAAPVPTASPGAAASEPAPAATAAPGAASSTMSEEDQKRYRTYVSTFVRRGTAIAVALGALQDCRAGRPQCHDRLIDARAKIDDYQHQLDATPAPSCLSGADERMRDGLAFQAQGLQLMQSAIDAQDRVALAQGIGLVVAGVWREGQAVAAARSSDC
jgi:hypothetical protein